MRIQRYFVLGVAWLSLAPCAFCQVRENALKQDGSVDKFIANLQGYMVNEGSGMRLDPAAICCAGYLPAAMFFNKSAPYVAFSIPTLEPTKLPSPLPEFNALPIFQLAPDEAIVLIGVTPPEAKYFSYMTYLLMRYYPPEALPKPIFAQLGDSINVSTVKTIGPGPFNRPVVLIFTPDQGTDARVRAALQKADYPDAIINTLPFPAHMLNLGVNRERDDMFIMLQRTAMFRDEIAGQAYVDAMSSADKSKRPLRVFRVTPTTSGVLKPFAAPPLRIHGTGRSEVDLTPALNDLREAILKYWGERGYKATEYHTKNTTYDGNEFISLIKNMWGDNRDTFALAAGYLPLFEIENELTLGENDFLIAYGPNHVATGKATYANINVYITKEMFPLASIYSDKFAGSVEPYRPYLKDDFPVDLMYTAKLTRGKCDGLACEALQNPPDGCTPWCSTKPCPPLVFDSSSMLGLFFRIYLEPPTAVGPAAGEILYDQVIKLSPIKY